MMYEDSKSTYAESYFLPLVEGQQEFASTILFIRITERILGHPIVVSHRNDYTEILNAPIGKISFLGALTIGRKVRNFLRDSKDVDRIVINRGIYPIWYAVVIQIMARDRFSFIYDSDGLAADEAYEYRRGLKSIPIYMISRMAEFMLVARAQLVLTRSELTKTILQSRVPISKKRKFAILNNGCVTKKYLQVTYEGRIALRKSLKMGLSDLILVYLGSFGKQYEFEEMLNLFRNIELENISKKLLILVPASEVVSVEKLILDFGIAPEVFSVRNVAHSETPKMLSAADIGFSLRKESFSMAHVKPLKTREYLFSGLCTIYSDTTGDLNSLPSNLGFTLNSADKERNRGLENWVHEVLENRETRFNEARSYAFEHLSIESDIKILNTSIHKVLDSPDEQ
ncbi:unannotated protein [freshwater metagenome]|uniref:Unannotated protein n=1 Tax=freshwater metagenome TaxID=449393 RepID=A0A6J6ZQF6_9ZZZZ|nr:hypothetical protein [Actinomycetota bacterium]